MAMDFVAVLQAIRRPRGKTLRTAAATMHTEQQQQQQQQQQQWLIPETCANSSATSSDGQHIDRGRLLALAYNSTA
jgi:hypothetical protein